MHFTTYLFNAGFPQLHTLLAIGGINMADQWKTIPRDKGVHMVVATPGRLVDLLGKGKINLDRCVYLSMDEADRLVDVTFEQNIREMLDHFKHQRQVRGTGDQFVLGCCFLCSLVCSMMTPFLSTYLPFPFQFISCLLFLSSLCLLLSNLSPPPPFRPFYSPQPCLSKFLISLYQL